jgi:outer membrane protein OmpA-like peptidoglycan-associated protein
MKQFPNMRVDVRSHTDSRSSAKHNAILSEQRAKATMNWLVKKGIERARLTSKGFGESRLINNCSDGVECTEAQHQVNRRSEFIVISIN